jgi:tetratricopeptide (TPR) repeat protein
VDIYVLKMKNYLLPALLGTIGLFSYALPTLALSPTEIQRIANRATVGIDRCAKGSGAIVRKDRNTYTVLTVANIVRNNNCEIVTPDNRRYQVSQVKIFPNNIDLALVSFTTNNNYPVAKLVDNSDRIEAGEPIYVAGFGQAPASSKPVFTFAKGDLVSNGSKQQGKGYSLIFSTNTLSQLNGSSIWNERGELLAMQGSSNVPTARVRTGYNLGIPVNTFTKYAAAAGIGGYAPVTIAPPPKPVDDAIAIAVLQENQGNYRGMLAELDRALFLDSQNARLYYSRGVAKSLLGNPDALGDYNRANELNPNDAATYNNRGVTKLDLNDTPGAIVDFNRSISIDPNRASAYYHRGNAKAARQPKDALNDFNRAISLDPQSARAYFSRGTLQGKLGDRKSELADFERTIAIDPNYTAAHEQLGFIKSNIGDFKGAIVNFDRAIALNSKNPETYSSRANARFKVGDDKGAIEDYNKAIAIDANNAGAYASRGLIKSKLGDKKGAILDLKKAANRFKRQRKTASYQKTIADLKRLGA